MTIFPSLHTTAATHPLHKPLRDSGLAMGGGKVYAAMVDDELGARCAGIFTQYNTACHLLECLIAKDETVRDLIGQSGNNRLTLSEYKRLFDQYSLDNAYWIEEKTMNQVSMS